MKLLILGCGNAGLAVATRAKALGWQVVATTTRESRIAEIEQVADRGLVVRGADLEAVKAAAADCDAILVSVSPPIMQSRTIEEREQSYRDVLVESCKSSVQACPRVVFMSSISVYADGLQGDGDLIDETTPRSTSDEPSTVYYSLADDAERRQYSSRRLAGCEPIGSAASSSFVRLGLNTRRRSCPKVELGGDALERKAVVNNGL